ncbi:MAG: hypothetical protein C4551_06590 [Bacillota bacterium]|jgi:hypothetical protein|nr:MAG: hypothetical protein C4551_06590 [Bacillota bacterium]
MPKRREDDYTITLSTNKGRSITMTADEFDRRVKTFLRMTPEEQGALLARKDRERRESDSQ